MTTLLSPPSTPSTFRRGHRGARSRRLLDPPDFIGERKGVVLEDLVLLCKEFGWTLTLEMWTFDFERSFGQNMSESRKRRLDDRFGSLEDVACAYFYIGPLIL